MNVLIIEDDAALLELLVTVIHEEGDRATTCTTAKEGRSAALGRTHDVIVLDWMLPDGDGVALCHELRASALDTPILMLTARGEVADRVTGLRSGADDYLTKPFEVEEFLARLGALVRRSRQGSSVRIGDLLIDRLERRAWDREQPIDLTSKEFELLLCLALRRGQAVPRAELLERIWNLNFDPGSGILDVHVSRLRDKLGHHAELVETVRGVGYRMRAEP
ncbi:MAG: response regulator transcription factor [Polyangiaceae bacterium]